MSASERVADTRARAVSVTVRHAWRVVPLGLRQSVLAVLLALAICFVIVVAVADDPIAAFQSFLFGTFRNTYSVGSMIAIATVLAVAALASSVAFRAGAFNIGTEGQLVLGGLTAAVVAPAVPGGGAVAVTVALVASAITGAVWIAVPTLLRVRYRTNEILTTLMFNYIAANVALFLVNNAFRDPDSGAVETPALDPSLWLARLLPPSPANAGLFVALGLGVLLWVWFDRTRSGMRSEVSGLQPGFAEYLGVHAFRNLAVSMLTSGAIAGAAGGLAILGISHSYISGFSPQYGFLGITVALIGRLRPAGVFAAALLYATLITGATAMQSSSDVPYSLVFVLQGVVILLITSQRIGGRAGA